MLDEAKKNKLGALPKYFDRIKEQQNRVDALRKTLETAQLQMTYTVGTWAKDRDCLWNIAKKPKIYDNAFLWPKIWQGNQRSDQESGCDQKRTGSQYSAEG